jgi:hypothetical protein
MLRIEQLEERDVPAVTFFTMTDTLRAHDEGGAVIWSERPFGAFPGAISLASGDVNGDGTPDAVIGAGPGGGPHVRVLNGNNGREMYGFFAYGPQFLGGVNVAAGDINDDGKADIITGAGPGGGPHVKVYNASDAKIIQSFFAGPANYNGGVKVASYGGVVETDLTGRQPIPVQTSQDLNSRPGAATTIYLSFGPNAPASAIPAIWQQVADYYAPYDVNITTVQPALASNRYATVIIGGTGSSSEGWAAGDLTDSTLGVAITNGYFQSNSFESTPAHAFADRIGWGNITQIARVVAHEAAHLFGLDHTTDPSSVMFEGIRPGRGQWDTISDLILALRLGRAR